MQFVTRDAEHTASSDARGSTTTADSSIVIPMDIVIPVGKTFYDQHGTIKKQQVP